MVFTRSQIRAHNAEIAEKAKLFAERAEIRRESELDVVAVAAEPEKELSSVMTQHSNDVEKEIMEEKVWKEEDEEEEEEEEEEVEEEKEEEKKEEKEDGVVVSVSVDYLRAVAVAVKDWIVTGVSVLAAAVTVVVCATSMHAGFGVDSNLMMAWQPMTDAVAVVMDCWTRFVINLQMAWILYKWGLWSAWIVFKWIVWPFFKWILWRVFKSYALKGVYVMEASVLVYILWRKVLRR